MHGLGDSGDGWHDLGQEIQFHYPKLQVILPHAPIQPVSLNGGLKMRSWHDIIDLKRIDQEDFKGLQESQRIIEDILDGVEKSGIPSNKIILAGFSQGAALAVY